MPLIDSDGDEAIIDSMGDLIDANCAHEWADSELGCEDCGSHPAVCCNECDAVLDLIYHEDPR